MEPLFSPYYLRRKKINPSDSFNRVDFVDQNGDEWQEFPVVHHQFKIWIENNDPGIIIENLSKSEIDDLFEQSPWFGSTANDIDWKRRVEMQAVIQKYTSHSISSTINLPNTATKQEVADIYMYAWKQGLKGVTVYRDGSRTGVLVTEESKTNKEFKEIDAIKRPKLLFGEGYVIKVKGEEWLIIIGLLDNKPYEIFATTNQWNVPKHFNCDIIKRNKKQYDICLDGFSVTIDDLTSYITNEEEAISRLISTSLRHGVNIKYIVEQLSKSYGTINSFSKALIRVLKKYIPEGELSTLTCLECGSQEIIFEEGCQVCKHCGSSKCS
jgi:ribonucleoside-diphosphate reductase alpha chain